ncbi:MAG: MATE family efflux transporter [Planctomycetes bacterium]|nr:MATE family efflux transporter [Planctomycetota bacterium]MCW8135793.1 MATE family efflux transporter [Planctomycetota bacterium]
MNAPAANSRLPAVLYSPDGTRRVDYRAVVVLAWPLFVQFGVQALLNVIDTWFVGRLGADAVAGMNAVNFSSFTVLLLFGGAGIAVQTIAAQRHGEGRKPRAAQAAWHGLYAAILMAPLAVGVALAGEAIFGFFALPAQVVNAASDYWLPRMAGGGLVVAYFALGNFFNGVGRTRISLMGAVVAALVNVALNWLLILKLGWGMYGAGLATTLAVACAVLFYTAVFFARQFRSEYATTRVWRPRARILAAVFMLGMPIGIHSMFDVGAFAAFQLMVGKLGTVPGAATQIAMILTSLAFLPVAGLNFAAATLVGQSIGVGDKDWAARVGSACIKLAFGWMALWALLFLTAGGPLSSVFVTGDDPNAQAVVELAATLLFIAAFYQLFDALNLGTLGCLRGAGDVVVPTVALLVLAWCIFVPLSHVLIFAPGEGWVDFLPQYGMGAKGGWIAALVHITLIGSFLLLRWKSGAWRKRLV